MLTLFSGLERGGGKRNDEKCDVFSKDSCVIGA